MCKSWVKVHGEEKKYTTTSAIMTSHPRLAWAVDAGWDGGDKALAFQLAVASGQLKSRPGGGSRCPGDDAETV